ncbi:hypothetical protein [Eubacterium sp.]|uniref:hypothetical protein n=1 Tax=Eubacterium sp. TaxID=142586 RepID=UPI0026DF044D|nr:hypothetical protein [Eubacterium sp.]MDO5432972.1 hypothetical protein [Eubacterium sp.]
MIYADYDYYKNDFHGQKITNEEFDRLAIKASAFLDVITFNQIEQPQSVTDPVKNAMCAVAEILQTYDSGSGGIASESVGKESITYANVERKTAEKESYNAAYPFLLGTGLLYRGG